MKNFYQLLTDFSNLIEIQKIKDEFQGGIEIESIFQDTELTPTNDLISLYEWHNGMKNRLEGEIYNLQYGLTFTDLYRGTNLFEVTTFLPIEIAFKQYEIISETNLFPKELFPIFYDDGTLRINLDLKSKNYGKIYYNNSAILIPEPMPIFKSLYDMFFTLHEGFKKKYFFYQLDEDGDFLLESTDDSNFFCEKLNPTCEFWTFDNDIWLNYTYKNE